MKKILVVFALFCAFFLVSCGSSDNNSAANMGKLGKECYPNETCDKGLRCDTDNNICVEDPENPINDSDRTDSGSDVEPDTGSDSDGGDSAPDSGDTAPDNGDTTSDGGDTAPDSGDTTPDEGDTADDSDNGDTASDNGDTTPDDDTDSVGPELNFPECSPTSETPCIDPNNLLVWSARSTVMLWSNAFEYCNNLDEGGYTDWRLPDLSILYTLVRNCSSEHFCFGGMGCSFTSCDSNSDGYYSIFGETAFLWSSLAYGDSEALGVSFLDGGIKNRSVINTMGSVRCVRIATTSATGTCSQIPEHAVYNTVSQIPLTWDWTNYWTPSWESKYNIEPSTTECRFKCEENYLFDSDSNQCLNPCNPNPCTGIGETGVCLGKSANEYACECENNYFWDGSSKQCLNPCNPNPCNSVEHSICTSLSVTEYICSCDNETDGYFWSGTACVNPCDANPCDSLTALTNKTCVAYTFKEYSCSGKDSSSGLIWSARASGTYTWSNAVSYCDNLTEGGYSDWHLPNIDELKTLLIANRVTSNCAVSEANNCLSDDCWSCSTCTQTGTQSSSGTYCSGGGTSYDDGRYSRLGDGEVWLWSSSTYVGYTDFAWFVAFNYGDVGYDYKTNHHYYVRCVR